MQVTTIYVLPTEHAAPPRAIVGKAEVDADFEFAEGFDSVVPDCIGEEQALAIWTGDVGMWMIEGSAIDPELAEAITLHARNLGVPGF